MKRHLVLAVLFFCILAWSQVTTTPNLQLQLPPRGTANYDTILNNNFSTIDTAIGVLQNVYQGAWSSSTNYSKGQEVNYLGTVYVSLTNSNFNNVPSISTATWAPLFTSSTGTVTSVGDLTGLFTVANRTTTPAFSLVAQNPNTVFAGPASGAAAAPTFRALVAGDIPVLINSSITGNAATSTSFFTLPTLCATGNYARGVDASGNAQGCTAAGAGGGPSTFTSVAHQFLNSYNSGTLAFTAAQPAFTDISGVATTSQIPSTVVYNSQANTYTAGSKQTFSANATAAGISFGGVTADPSTLSNGDLWYRSDISRLMVRAAGATQQIAFSTDIPVVPANTTATTSQFFTAYNSTTGAFTKAQPAPADVSGSGTAGNYMRSNGTTWASSAIQAGDVPVLNQNTTGIASGNYANWNSGPIAGNISSTTGVIIVRTTLPAAIKVRSFTMYLGTATSGCTTLPAYQLFDNTASTVISTITLVNGTAYYSNTGLNVTVPSGDDLVIKVGTGSVACTQQPSNAEFTAWYTM